MLTLLTGAPGTGKTAAVVSMLRELSKDRALYVCNLNGLQIPHIELADATKWHTDVPDGSVIVIDEVQHYWRPRGPGQKVPDWIAALETHRHRGLDFYVITQGPNLLDSNVRALVGRHVHLRELGILGRWWYEWPECADNCRTAWKNAPIKKRYRLPKKIFGDYKSASVHIKPKRSFPLMLAVLVLAIGYGGYKGWGIYQTIMGKLDPAIAAAAGLGSGSSSSPAKPAASATSTVSSSAPAKQLIDDRVDWIPRISSRPETAPAYDAIRTVVTMPRVAAGFVMGKRVKCYTQQGTDAGLTDTECRAWLANTPFDPYTPSAKQDAPVQATRDETRPETASAPALTLIGDATPARSLPAKPPRVGGGPT